MQVFYHFIKILCCDIR